MQNQSTALLGAMVVAMLAACGGGGGGAMEREAPAAASPSSTAAQAGATLAANGMGTNSPSAAGVPLAAPSDSAADPAPPLDPLVAHRVHAELDQIELALRRLDSGKVERMEALEVLKDARSELDKERPNKLKIRSLLTGLAQAAQALDGAKGSGKFLPQLIALV